MAYTSYTTSTLSTDSLNPLNFIQDIFLANDWAFERCADDELLAEVEGRWTPYRFSFLWRDDMQALSFACVVDLETLSCAPELLYELASRVNDQMWFGHFDVTPDDPSFSYRYTLPVYAGNGMMMDQIGDIIDTAFLECDRFYPAFQFVVTGEKKPKDALVAAVADVQGEA